MARPCKPVNPAEIVRLRRENLSFPEIARRTRLGVGTVHRAYQGAVDAPQPFQNLSKTILQTEPHENSAEPAAKVQCNTTRQTRSAEKASKKIKPSENIQVEPRRGPFAEVSADEAFAALWSAWRAVGGAGNLLKLRDEAEMNFRQVIAQGASVEAILEELARWVSWWDNTGWQYCQQNLSWAIRNRLWLTAPPG